MSDRFNCPIHGVRRVDSYNDGCPECETTAWELKNAVSDAGYRSANPGDYECPHCRYRSLLRDASRCPLCHGEIAGNYWIPVRAQEKAETERKRAREAAATAEWIRTAPEREALARAATLAAAEERELKRQRAHSEDVQLITIVSSVWLVICLIVGTVVGYIWGIPFIVTLIGALVIAGLISIGFSTDVLKNRERWP